MMTSRAEAGKQRRAWLAKADRRVASFPPRAARAEDELAQAADYMRQLWFAYGRHMLARDLLRRIEEGLAAVSALPMLAQSDSKRMDVLFAVRDELLDELDIT